MKHQSPSYFVITIFCLLSIYVILPNYACVRMRMHAYVSACVRMCDLQEAKLMQTFTHYQTKQSHSYKHC